MSVPSPPPFGRPPCDRCGRALTVHEQARGTTCDAPECRRRALTDRLRSDAREREERRRRVDWERMRILAGFGVPETARVLPVVLPSNDRPLADLPEARRRAFREHLAAAARDAAAGRLPRAEEPWIPAEETEEDERVVAESCALCRGKCCQTGYGRNAYVDAGLLRRWLDRHPGKTPEDAAAAYAERIPERSYEESCVYHTETGCALPRGMRADICNGWICEGLSDWFRRRPPDAPRRAFLASVVDGRVDRHRIVDGEEDPPSA